MKTVVAILLLATTTLATIVSECDDVAFPVAVNVENCDEEPCAFVRGKDVHMNMTFVAPEDLTALAPKVLAKSLGVQIQYPLNDKDGCKVLISGQCPLKKGQQAIYHLTMPVLKIFPLVPLSLTFTMENQDNEAFVCFTLDANVVDS